MLAFDKDFKRIRIKKVIAKHQTNSPQTCLRTGENKFIVFKAHAVFIWHQQVAQGVSFPPGLSGAEMQLLKSLLSQGGIMSAPKHAIYIRASCDLAQMSHPSLPSSTHTIPSSHY